jgi:hypothetical protein
MQLPVLVDSSDIAGVDPAIDYSFARLRSQVEITVKLVCVPHQDFSSLCNLDIDAWNRLADGPLPKPLLPRYRDNANLGLPIYLGNRQAQDQEPPEQGFRDWCGTGAEESNMIEAEQLLDIAKNQNVRKPIRKIVKKTRLLPADQFVCTR